MWKKQKKNNNTQQQQEREDGVGVEGEDEERENAVGIEGKEEEVERLENKGLNNKDLVEKEEDLSAETVLVHLIDRKEHGGESETSPALCRELQILKQNINLHK